MKQKNILFALLALAAAAAIILAGCRGKSETPERAVLRAAYLPTANYLTILTKDNSLAEELVKEGAGLEFIGPSAPVDALKIVTSGNADITTTGTGYFINLVQQGGGWTAFALEKYSGDSQGIVAAPGSGVNTLKDLYGKKIGIAQRGGTADYIVNTAFAHAGLDVSQVEKIELAQADFAAAFGSGHIDAIASFDQNFANAIATPGAKKIIDGTEYGSLNWSIHIARRDFAEKHPELLAAAYRALRAQADKARAEPSVITGAYKELGASEAQINIIKTFDVPQILPMDAQALADLGKQARQYADYGFIPGAPQDFSPYALDVSAAGK